MKQKLNLFIFSIIVKIMAIKNAEARAHAIKIEAEADADAKALAGEGLARQRENIVAGLERSVNIFKGEVSDVNSQTVMDMIMVIFSPSFHFLHFTNPS